jgi:hypothetical protein
MDLTLLLVNFLHEDWSARCCELRGDPSFRIQTGDRRIPKGGHVLEIGMEYISTDGWSIRQDDPCSPFDRWATGSPGHVEFEIKYMGLTPPQGGVGGYNLILPRGWRFVDPQVSNENYYGPNYEFAYDDRADKEALALYFAGENISFSLTTQATRSAHVDQTGLGSDLHFWPRSLTEPIFPLRQARR